MNESRGQVAGALDRWFEREQQWVVRDMLRIGRLQFARVVLKVLKDELGLLVAACLGELDLDRFLLLDAAVATDQDEKENLERGKLFSNYAVMVS